MPEFGRIPGVGLVIMKPILTLHWRELCIDSALAGAAIVGTRLVLRMPRTERSGSS